MSFTLYRLSLTLLPQVVPLSPLTLSVVRRVERDAPAGCVRPLIEPYVQFSRIRLTVWKFVFIAPVPRTFSVSFHFGHDGIVQLGQAVYGSPHHLRIAPFDSPFGQYISHPHVLCLPFSRRGPSLHGRYPLPRYYGLVRLLASLSLPRGLPSSLAELSGHAILLCPAAFRSPKSIRWSPVGFMMSEHWPRGI